MGCEIVIDPDQVLCSHCDWYTPGFEINEYLRCLVFGYVRPVICCDGEPPLIACPKYYREEDKL